MELRRKISSRRLGEVSLILVALIWGFNFIVIKSTIQGLPPLYYLGVRFLVAFGISVLISWRHLAKLRLIQIAWCLLVGFLLFGAFAAQTVGLQWTTPGLSAFLTAIYVLLVPLILALWFRHLPRPSTVVAALLMVAGLGVLFFEGNFIFGIGEALTALSALLFALHIIALGRAANDISPLCLATIQLGVVGVLSFILSLVFEAQPTRIDTPYWAALIYGAVFGSVLAYYLQSWAQKITDPSHVGILLSLEAVFALAFSYGAGMESISWRGMTGFALVFAGTVFAEWTFSTSQEESLTKRFIQEDT